MSNEQDLVRLQKYIADCGIASRRKAEELILHKKVMVNQKIVSELGVKVDPKKDVVVVDGQKIEPETQKVYIMLNKPVGYITTSKDQFNRPTVLDLLKEVKYRVYAVGRLDYDTSGLLILTNDGDLANRIMHPKFKINKTYVAEVMGILKKNELEALRNGVAIEDYVTSPAHVEIEGLKGKITTLRITIHEGRNRQVRKMCAAVGHKVVKLKRVELGSLNLGRLKEGQWRNLTRDEIKFLKSL